MRDEAILDALTEPPKVAGSQVVFYLPRGFAEVLDRSSDLPTLALTVGGAIPKLAFVAIALLLPFVGKTNVDNGLCHGRSHIRIDMGVCVAFRLTEQYSHEPYIAVARFQVKYLGKPVASLEPRLVERGHAALARLDHALTDHAYLVGESVSLADISLVAYTRMAGDGGFDLAPYAAVRAWIARVEAAINIYDTVAQGA